ncbi:unnamed protein product, partial [Mesorhabditis spiculigera]
MMTTMPEAGAQPLFLGPESPLATKFPTSVSNYYQCTDDVISFAETEQLEELWRMAESRALPSLNGFGPSRSIDEPSTARHLDDCSIFENMQYLGSSMISDPSDEGEMMKIVRLLDEKADQAIRVSLAVPRTVTGTVTLSDPSGSALASFPVARIRFCVRGRIDTPQKNCFALSFTHHNPGSSDASHQCHVFRSSQPDTAGRALYCFSQAFTNKETDASSPGDGSQLEFKFEAFLEIREEDTVGKETQFTLCSQQSNTFKLRRDRKKKLVVHLKQASGRCLTIKKCFGMLLAAGRNLRHSDMQLLGMESMAPSPHDPSVYMVSALWDPKESNFEVLNTETPRDTRVFMTIALDVIMAEVGEPIRFSLECKARVHHQYERFYRTQRVPVVETFYLSLQKSNDSTNGTLVFVQIESETERTRTKGKLGRSPSKMPAQLLQPTGDDESDSDEPLLSGSGNVNREVSDDVLAEWQECIKEWKAHEEGHRPEKLTTLLANGVPDLVRGEVWQLFAKVHMDPELIKTYHLLLGKECAAEQIIMRDIHRTFPAHERFKEAGGEGQEGLYKISKAYALYDEEVSYCQGLSFLAASLLLHMPEEQAFCTLVKIMFDYQLRDLFKLGFDSLHLRFYQLNRLIKDYEPELAAHLDAIGVETHMYASQWFLTLFTAKFPLQMVFFIVDLFLAEGMNTIFHISLALLKDAKQDLLQLDFEGALKYFRVSLPRRYRTEQNAKKLIQQAVSMKISHKRLSKYESEYMQIKEDEAIREDPVKRLQRENAKNCETILRLDRENDDLAHELVTSKIELRKKLDLAEDQIETANNTVERLTRQNSDLIEENKHLHAEYEQIKEMCRREVERLEDEAGRNKKLLDEYKELYAQLNKRHDKQKQAFDEEKKAFVTRVQQCDQCWPSVEQWEKNRSPVRTPNGDAAGALELLTKLEEREAHVRAVELELAQTKLALVEAQCRNQDLSHQMSTSVHSDSGDTGRKWFKKTITSLKEVSTQLKGHERSNSTVSNSDRF